MKRANSTSPTAVESSAVAPLMAILRDGSGPLPHRFNAFEFLLVGGWLMASERQLSLIQ
jgi:hypothetical protein